MSGFIIIYDDGPPRGTHAARALADADKPLATYPQSTTPE